MLFNSTIFLLFAALFFAAWPILRRRSGSRWAYLTVASFIFYGWWDWRFLLLILASGLIDFVAALAMQTLPQRRRWFLLLSIAGNVGSLATFKYSRFIAENIDAALGTHLAAGLPELLLILPVGISFYTFQSMSYTIDVYRGRLQPTRNVLHFFAYLSMFPQLVAGPIVRGVDLLPALEESRPTDEAARTAGLRLIVHGFFKKVVIADNLAPTVNSAFGAATVSNGSLYWWLVVTMFAFQIYCDFSGYSAIARGLAKWMGYDYPLNFDHPYISTSLREFWTRWHISLSTWFRDYVYIPLGGSRTGGARVHANLWVTMVVSGLWHGAAWTFVLWGAMHALFMSIERITRWPSRIPDHLAARLVASALVLTQVWLAWVVFRAESVSQAVEIAALMFSFSGGNVPISAAALVILGVAVAREMYFYFGLHDVTRFSMGMPRAAQPTVLAFMIVACVFLRGPGSAFIYFQF